MDDKQMKRLIAPSEKDQRPERMREILRRVHVSQGSRDIVLFSVQLLWRTLGELTHALLPRRRQHSDKEVKR